MSPFGRLSSRAGRALEALAVTGCLLVAVGPAAADHPDDPHCKPMGGTNACLWVSPRLDLGDDIYLVRVTADISMGAEDVQAAEQRKAEGGQVCYASIFGRDPGEDGLRFDMRNPPVVQEAGQNGWGCEFHYTATGQELDEDDGEDDIVGKMYVIFPRFPGQTVTYETGQVNHHF